MHEESWFEYTNITMNNIALKTKADEVNHIQSNNLAFNLLFNVTKDMDDDYEGLDAN